MYLRCAVVLLGLWGGAWTAGCQQAATQPLPPASTPTMAEINAATSLAFDWNKLEALQRVALRPTTTPAEQAHLVEIGLRYLTMDDSKKQLIKTLISNPNFAPEAKVRILNNINRFQLTGVRAEVLRNLDARGQLTNAAK